MKRKSAALDILQAGTQVCPDLTEKIFWQEGARLFTNHFHHFFYNEIPNAKCILSKHQWKKALKSLIFNKLSFKLITLLDYSPLPSPICGISCYIIFRESKGVKTMDSETQSSSHSHKLTHTHSHTHTNSG